MSGESRISPLVRPVMLGVVGFSTFGVAVIAGTIEAIWPGHGARFGAAVAGALAQVPEAVWDLLSVLGLGYIGGKTVERATTVHATAKYDKPARVSVGEGEEP